MILIKNSYLLFLKKNITNSKTVNKLILSKNEFKNRSSLNLKNIQKKFSIFFCYKTQRLKQKFIIINNILNFVETYFNRLEFNLKKKEENHLN